MVELRKGQTMKMTATKHVRQYSARLKNPALLAIVVSSAGFSPAQPIPAQHGFAGTLPAVSDLQPVAGNQRSWLGQSDAPHFADWRQPGIRVAVQATFPAPVLAQTGQDYGSIKELTTPHGGIVGSGALYRSITAAIVASPARQQPSPEESGEMVGNLLSSVMTLPSANQAEIDGSLGSGKEPATLAPVDAKAKQSVSGTTITPYPATDPDPALAEPPAIAMPQLADAAQATITRPAGARPAEPIGAATSAAEPAGLVSANTQTSETLAAAATAVPKPKLLEVDFVLAPTVQHPVRLAPQRTPVKASVGGSRREAARSGSSRYRLTGRGVEFTMPVVIDGTMQGSVAMLVSQTQTAEVKLQDLLGIVAPLLPADELQRLGNAPAASEFVSLRKLREAGLDFRYDAALDRLTLSRD